MFLEVHLDFGILYFVNSSIKVTLQVQFVSLRPALGSSPDCHTAAFWVLICPETIKHTFVLLTLQLLHPSVF